MQARKKIIDKMEIKGTDAITGLPRRLEIDSVEVREALQEPINAVVEEIKRTLGQTPPELASDIVERGVVMTGGRVHVTRFAQTCIQRNRRSGNSCRTPSSVRSYRCRKVF